MSQDEIRRRTETFGGAETKHGKSRGQRKTRPSVNGSDDKHRYSRTLESVPDPKHPRITKAIEAEWERELRKQLDKFLKSKNALKGLEKDC